MATPTYLELAQLSSLDEFRFRCTIACAQYARFILNENPATDFHQARYRWAVDAAKNPAATVLPLLPLIAMDSIFASQNPLNLATTPDTGAGSIQVAVEATINATLLKF